MVKKLAILGVAVFFVLGAASSALAAGPSEHASCMGHEASAISPPGSSEEFPNGMPGLRAFIGENFPVPPGVIYSTIAKLHEGSHEACDEALEG